MKIAFNPSTVAALTTPPNNKDITFDLRGRNIFARGVKFYGTDTNTWRDIKINNVSIGSHTLDLQNGSNTTLTNTNGVVTINSTWRPVVDNLTSDSTTSSLSAKQGKVLKALIDGKSNSDHNHDGRYVRAFGTSNDNIDSDWGQSFKTFDSIPLGTPPEKNPNISLLSIGENFNRRKQLAFIWNNDNIYYRRRIDSGFTNWRRLAFANEIPTSLKNPYALTISLNGTSQGPYDGSAAKNINITPGSIGAAVSNHSHDYLVVNSADDKSFNSAYHNFQVLYAGGGNRITGKPAKVDAFGLFKFRAAIGWSGQMLLANGGSLYIRSSEDAKMTNTLAWKTILDSSNYSGILDSRYYTESEVHSLLDAKLNRQNLSYGTWNPRGYHLAAGYEYNGGDLSISESGGKIHVSVDGYFWQNEGQYRVLDTSDVAGLKSNLTVHQYLSATDAAWYPLVWGGNSHNNTSDSTGAVYKSYDKLSWQTSSQTLYATNIQTNNIKNLSIGGGIYWNPYVESASDGSDAASITLVRQGVARGTTLVLSQMDNPNDTIQFKTNTAARLYHNSYPILTTQNTYVNNNKGYIYGNEITQVNNADKVDNRHAISTTPNTGIIYKAAIYTAHSLTSYWVRLASIPSIGQNEEFVATIHVQSGHSGFGRNAILLVYLRGGASSYLAKGFNICCNSNYDPNRFRLYYKDSNKTSEIWYQTTGQWDGIITTVISQSSEGLLYEGLTLYSGIITAVQTPSMSTYLSAQVSTITDNISGNASTATKLQTPRTIWGQSFDGTGNVSGSLSEVGNIHFKVNNSYDIGSDAAASRYIYTHWLGARSGQKLELGANNSGFGQGLCIDTNLNVGIGTTSPTQKLDVAGNIRTTGQIIREGHSNMWVYGRIAALLRETSAVGYHTLWSLKTTNGSWDFGEYNAGSDWNNIPVLSYITDSNYNSGNDAATYQIKFPLASGTVALTSNIPNPTNYYWANVKISASSSTTTSPTVLNLTATNSIRMGDILLERTNEINNSANNSIDLNFRNSGNVSLCVGGGKVGIGTIDPTQELHVQGCTYTKGFGIGIWYLSDAVYFPFISPGDGHIYRCVAIGRLTKVSCIIADKAPLSGVRGVLLKFMQGFDGQIVLLKDLENYGSGNGNFWVMPSGCDIIRADSSNILIHQNEISNTYDDGRSRFLIYSARYNVWIEFYCK